MRRFSPAPSAERLGRRRPAGRIAVLCCILGLGLGCAAAGPGPAGAGPTLDYFQPPARSDLWSPKISGWQSRETAETPDLPGVSEGLDARGRSAPGTDLETKYEAFRAARKRALALEVAGWIQGQAPDHYVADGAVDHWATLAETLRKNGEDCDGLELLVYHFLRESGFDEDEVFRAIVHRPADGQHHMVTLWFEDPHDPWVIDPTGAMARGMPRMSQVAGWVPLKVFSETAEYTVRSIPLADRR